MRCSDAQPHLPVFADGELASSLHASVEAHVSDCGKCRDIVDRWRALRGAANRAAHSFPVPSGLDEQIVRALAAERGAALRQRRWAGSGLISAAAILLLAVTIWKFGPLQSGSSVDTPPPSNIAMAGTVVSPAEFVKYYDRCATRIRHDLFNIRNQTVSFARTAISGQTDFSVAVPDLSRHGYFVDGGCTCLKLANTNGHTVHVYYRRSEDDVNPISIFSMPQDVCFAGPPQSVTRGGKRVYQETVYNGVVLLIWHEAGGCYAACAKLPKDELYALVDSLDITAVTGHRSQSGSLKP